MGRERAWGVWLYQGVRKNIEMTGSRVTGGKEYVVPHINELAVGST